MLFFIFSREIQKKKKHLEEKIQTLFIIYNLYLKLKF